MGRGIDSKLRRLHYFPGLESAVAVTPTDECFLLCVQETNVFVFSSVLSLSNLLFSMPESRGLYDRNKSLKKSANMSAYKKDFSHFFCLWDSQFACTAP